MGEIINLFTDGKVEQGEREFTRLVGGFNNTDAVMTTKQIGKLLGLDNRVVNQTINRNIEHFNENVDIIDLKSAITDSDSELLANIDYTRNAFNASKNVYLLSKAGFLLYLKFAEGDKAVELYKDFLEDYFKTKTENEVMKSTIETQIEELNKEKKFLIGEVAMAENDTDRIKFLQLLESKNKQITNLEKSMSEKHIIEKLSSKTHLADLIANSKSNFDIGVFSRILGIKNMGRNNMFSWMREKKLLMEDNIPYQIYSKYFDIVPVMRNGYTTYKTVLKPKGVDYIMKRLIKDGKIVTKTVEEVLEELQQVA